MQVSTVIVRLRKEDVGRPGMYLLSQLISSYLADQFELSVAIRIEDEDGNMIREMFPAGIAQDFIDAHPEVIKSPTLPGGGYQPLPNPNADSSEPPGSE
jgi:hypothetical protein